MTTIIERPHSFSFSKNEIRYILHTDDTTAPGCAVDIEIHYLPVDLSADVTLITVTPTPDNNGDIYFHIEDYLKSILAPQMPDPAGAMIQPVADQVKYFYIRYREISATIPSPEWIDDIDNKGMVLLGGVEQAKFRRNNFFSNYLADHPRFLTWQVSGKRVFAEQEHFLTFLITAATTSLSVNVKTVFTDMSQDNTGNVHSLTGNYSKLWRVRCGIMALGLNMINPTKTIYYYEISIRDADVATTIAAPFRFYADYNTFYSFHDFHYFNSLGGIDTVRLLGQFNNITNIVSDDLEHINDKEDFTSAFPVSQFSQANIVKRDTYKGDVGWSRTQIQQETLIELMMSKGIFENVGGRWIRILNLQKSQDLGADTDKKWSFPLEWSYGYADVVFTPKGVNLGAGIAYVPPPPPPPPICVAVTLPAYAMPDGTEATAYNYSVALGGTAPITITGSVTKPSWMTIGITGGYLTFTGTPDTVATGINISLTLSNCSGDTADFSDTIDIAAAVTAHFGSTTVISADASDVEEQVALVGIPGSTVTITLTTVDNTNDGLLTAQGATAYISNTWDVVLNSSGNGTFSAAINGNSANTGTIIRGIFTITSTSTGSIGTPVTYQISKIF